MIVQMSQAKTVLELGTFTGYSALCFAEGLAPDGKVVTIDNDERAVSLAQKYFRQSEHKSKVCSNGHSSCDGAGWPKVCASPVPCKVPTPHFRNPVCPNQPESVNFLQQQQKNQFNEGSCVVVKNTSVQLCSMFVHKQLKFSWKSVLCVAARGHQIN